MKAVEGGSGTPPYPGLLPGAPRIILVPTPYFRQAGRASKLEFMGLITFFCRPLTSSPGLSPSQQTSRPPSRGPFPGTQTSQEGFAVAEHVSHGHWVWCGQAPSPGTWPLPHACGTPFSLSWRKSWSREIMDSNASFSTDGYAGALGGPCVSLGLHSSISNGGLEAK